MKKYIVILLLLLVGCSAPSKIIRHNGAHFMNNIPSSTVTILTSDPKDISSYDFVVYKVVWADGLNTPLPALIGVAAEQGIEFGADIGIIKGAGENYDMKSDAAGYGITTTVGISPGQGGQVGSSPTPGISKAWSTSGYRGLPWLHVVYFKRVL